jgi:hypothetical protein
MKKILVFIMCFFSVSCFAFAPMADKTASLAAFSSCAQAVPTTDGGFCPSFKTVATCHCIESGIPSKACQNMDLLYAAMIGRYKTVESACANQHDTSTQNCIDDWQCYRSGGSTAGGLCSATGNKCG